MKIVLILLLSGLVLIGLMALVGSCLPRRHTASRAAFYRRSPLEVYAVVRDFGKAPAWRKEVTRVELAPPGDGPVAYREYTRGGAIGYLVRSDRPGEQLVTEIADRDLPYGGTWTFDFSPEGAGTRLRITENGEVKNVLFRFLGRWVFGHTRTLEAYLRALGRTGGEEVTPLP